ncbi:MULTISPECIES: 3-dehydroquinate synthase [unclassified Moraxella]|uniref:3-dehydroquinate synthase n=1 Tax=unclassified Moraxella TaxID=2685852 RepID=UPI003AF6CDDE
MQSLMVQTRSHDYPIFIGQNLLQGFDFLPYIAGQQILVVTNDTVAPLYLATLLAQLPTDKQVATCILSDGEQYKTQDSINNIYDALMQAHFNRDCTLIALGGGVIGDMVGFAAATFMRGVDFIQIPTTLLSQVDSSVGGKTGINHPLGKNMIGAFWQPKLVLADMSTLTSLPARELSAGLAEVIKYALIGDVVFLAWLEQHMTALVNLDLDLLAQAVLTCCQHKAKIVAEDEFEQDKRALLNFGHTFGHVIETHEGYGTWLHGEAVAVGMVQAMQLSQLMGWLDTDDVQRAVNLIAQANLPITPPVIDSDTVMRLMSHDKKVKAGQIRLILLKQLGEAVVTADYNPQALAQVIQPVVVS